MINYSFNSCKHLVLFTSESCNLQCSYCDMNKHFNNKYHLNEANLVKESMKNGVYLNNLKQIFQRLGIDPNQIKNLDLWGQEPTLTLNEFSIMFQELYQYCPNINHLFFSTNGVGFTDSIISFIKIIDLIVKNNFQLKIQFSYDGFEWTKKSRGINSQIILNNIMKIIEELNKIELQNLKITFQFHNVISKEIFSIFADKSNNDDLFDYLKEFQNIFNNLKLKNINQNVTIQSFRAGLETPLNASVEDGKNLFAFINNCKKNEEKMNSHLIDELIDSCIANISLENLKLVSILCYSYLNNGYVNNEHILKLLSRLKGCKFNNNTILKIRYDGTLLYCQNGLYSIYNKNINNISDIDNLIQQTKLNKNFYPNAITDSDEILNNYFYQTFSNAEYSFFPAFSQACNYLKLLIQSNQIDIKYERPDLFFFCAYFFCYILSCPHNSIMYNGTLYGTYLGLIRLFCNGFMDIIIEQLLIKENNK